MFITPCFGFVAIIIATDSYNDTNDLTRDRWCPGRSKTSHRLRPHCDWRGLMYGYFQNLQGSLMMSQRRTTHQMHSNESKFASVCPKTSLRQPIHNNKLILKFKNHCGWKDNYSSRWKYIYDFFKFFTCY